VDRGGGDAAADELSVQTTSVVADAERGQVVEAVPLTDDEVAMLSSLAPLVRTPRTAKRLFNLYRLLRSTRDLRPSGSFLGAGGRPGQYQAVAVLLGLLTAHPSLMNDLTRAPADPARGLAGGFMARPSSGNWKEFVAGLTPRQDGRTWRNDVTTELDREATDEWWRLVEDVGPATDLVTLPDLQAFQAWEPHVARFSFRYARQALDRRAPTGVGP
jgi:hypothetical protein